jgi:hypothetical protein
MQVVAPSSCRCRIDSHRSTVGPSRQTTTTRCYGVLGPALAATLGQQQSNACTLTSKSFREVEDMSSWIFQGNPSLFRIDEYLKTAKSIVWSIMQKHFLKAISVGDEVYIWRADGHERGTGGIVARGTITSTPKSMLDDAPSLWTQPEVPPSKPRVHISLDEVRLTEVQGMIGRAELGNDSITRDMLILRFPSLTN